jgi:hypothetical protein
VMSSVPGPPMMPEAPGGLIEKIFKFGAWSTRMTMRFG